MKYFITEDGRILEFDDGTISKIPCTIGELVEGEIGVYRGINIIKQSDTIEKLSDEYIVDETKYEYGKNKPYISEHEFHKWLEEIDFAFECKVGLYLGIWVGAELKPVAKINSEGKPELLWLE